MYAVIWEYEVHPGAESAFETLHGPDGAWVRLFCEYPGYVETELLRDQRPRHYLTIDRWESEDDYAAFQSTAATRYAEIDAMGDALTVRERRIGRYTAC